MSSVEADAANRLLIQALELRVLPHRGISRPQFSNLQRSARAGMLRIFRDELSRPIGYIAWAMVDRASLDRLLRFGRYPAYQYEWKEGGFCLILDVLVASHGRCEAIRRLREFARSQRALVYAREGEKVRLLVRRGGRLQTWNVTDRTTSPLMSRTPGVPDRLGTTMTMQSVRK